MAINNNNPLYDLGSSPLAIAPSLADQKVSTLNQSLADKQANIAPNQGITPQQGLTPLEEYYRLTGYTPESTGGSNIIDQAQSSLYGVAGTTYDLFSDAGEGIAKGLGFDNIGTGRVESLDRLSEQKYADQAAGFTPEARQAYAQGIQEDVSDRYAQGNYLGAFGGALSHAPELIADSAGSIAQIVGGTLATGGLSTVGAIAKGIAAIAPKAPKLAKALNFINKSFPITGGAVLYGADRTNQQMDEYKENNGGKDMPLSQVIPVASANTLLGAMDFGIFKDVAKNVTPKQFISDGAELVKSIGLEKGTKIVRDSIAKNSGDILATAGKEALQEYAETWTEILAVAKEGTDSFTQENQDKAAVGAILGAAAGGTTQAVTSVPKAAASTAVGGVKKAGEVVANKLQTKAVKAANKILTPKERERVQKKYAAEDKLYNIFVAEKLQENEELSKVQTQDELRSFDDEGMNKVLDSLIANEEDITPRVIEKIANKKISDNKGEINIGKTALEARRAKDATYKVVNNAKNIAVDKVKELTGVTSEDIDKATEKVTTTAKKTYKVTKNISGEVLDSVINLETSAARGIYNKMSDGVINSDTVNKISELSVEDINALESLVGDSKKGRIVVAKAKKLKEQALKTVGIESGVTISELSEKSSILKALTKDKLTEDDTVILVNELFDTVSNTIASVQVKKQIDEAIKKYEDSGFSDTTTARILKNSIKISKATAVKLNDAIDTALEDTEDTTSEVITEPTETKESKGIDYSSKAFEEDNVATRAAKFEAIIKMMDTAGGDKSKLPDGAFKYAGMVQKDIQTQSKATTKSTDEGTALSNQEAKNSTMSDKEATAKAEELNIELCN